MENHRRYLCRELWPYKNLQFYHQLFWRIFSTANNHPDCIRYFHWILLIQFTACIRYILLSIYPFNNEIRILLCDYFAIQFRCRQANLLLVPLILFVEVYRILYLENNSKIFALLKGVLLPTELYPDRPNVLPCHHLDNVKRHAVNILNVLQIFIFVFLLAFLSVHFRIYRWLWLAFNLGQKQSAKDWTSKILESLGIFFIVEFNICWFFADLFVKIRILICSVSIISTYTRIFFVKFNHIKKIIELKSSKRLTNACLDEFFHQHTNLASKIFIFDRTISKIFVWIMFSCLPFNLYLAAWILVNINQKITQDHLAAYALFLATIIGVFGMHYTFTLYPDCIHKKSGVMKLIQLNAGCYYRRRNTYAINLKNHLKMCNYIEKFHVKNRYGISYYNSELVTLNSFFKVNIISIDRNDLNRLIIYSFFFFSFPTILILIQNLIAKKQQKYLIIYCKFLLCAYKLISPNKQKYLSESLF